MKREKRLLSLALALILSLSTVSPALAADSATAATMRLGEYTGTVTVENASGKTQTTKKDLRLYNGYTLSTDRDSSAYITMDETKAIKLDASSKVGIKKNGKQLEIFLTSGQLYFDVTAPLKGDESLNIRTSTMITGVRGSYGWVNTKAMGLMHGHVTLTCINPESGDIRVTEVYSGEMVYYDADVADIPADPELLEIDFVKEEITNDDVPSFVVEEMRKDESLQTPVIEDVETVDVPALLDLYDEKRAAEEDAVEQRQLEIDEQLREQDEIAGTGGPDYLFREESPTSGSGSGSNSGSGTGSGASNPAYTVTYTDGAGGTVFADDTHTGLSAGDATPAFAGETPTRNGYVFNGWSPAVERTVTADATYTAQWLEKQSYTLTVPAGAGYTFAVTNAGDDIVDNGGGSYTVTSGATVDFTVTVASTHYADGTTLKVASNGTDIALTEAAAGQTYNGSVTVSSDTNIAVSGVYIVFTPEVTPEYLRQALNDNSGVAITSNATLTDEVAVEYGQTLVIGKAATLTTSATLVNNGGTVIVNGTLALAGATLTNTASIVLNGEIAMSGDAAAATINHAGPLPTTITIADAITKSGSSTGSGAAITGSGSITGTGNFYYAQ